MKESFKTKCFLAIIVSGFLAAACASSPVKNGGNITKGPYYTGDAGEGITLAVLQPKGINIPKGQEWFLPMIQGSLTSDFNKFSKMTVLDRQHLDQILSEQNLSMNGNFSDDDFIRIGHLTNARYILIGTVTKTGANNFLLELAITDPETGIRLASFGPKGYSLPDMQDMYAAKDAAFEIMSQIGIELTESGKKAIYEPAESSVSAETALAKGITSQNSGATPKTKFETMYYLYEAQALDPSLLEAASRLEAYQADIFTTPEITIPELSMPVRTGNIGADARNEIARYKAQREAIQEQQRFLLRQRDVLLEQQKTLLGKQKELIDLLHGSEDFYIEHPPFEIIYSPALERTGGVNYQEETVDLQFRITSMGLASNLGVMKSIIGGLSSVRSAFEDINAGLDRIDEQIGKVNEAGKEYAVQPVSGIKSGDKTLGESWSLDKWTGGGGRSFTVEAALTNEDGKTIGAAAVSLVNGIAGTNYAAPENAGAVCIFYGVPVDEIGDVLKVTIQNINGVDIVDPANSGYMKVSVVDESGYTKDGINVNGYDKNGFDQFGYNVAGFDKKGFNREGYNKAGYNRDGRDKNGVTVGKKVARAAILGLSGAAAGALSGAAVGALSGAVLAGALPGAGAGAGAAP